MPLSDTHVVPLRAFVVCVKASVLDSGINRLKWGVRLATGVQLPIHSYPRATSNAASCPFHSITYYFQVNTTRAYEAERSKVCILGIVAYG
ncbi:hypothetical protein Trydic_g17898 [Trypoxylus dichotomus]